MADLSSVVHRAVAEGILCLFYIVVAQYHLYKQGYITKFSTTGKQTKCQPRFVISHKHLYQFYPYDMNEQKDAPLNQWHDGKN